MRTIPQIAEELRDHLRTDNDAKRLITELILPLVEVEEEPDDGSGLGEIKRSVEAVIGDLQHAVDHLQLVSNEIEIEPKTD